MWHERTTYQTSILFYFPVPIMKVLLFLCGIFKIILLIQDRELGKSIVGWGKTEFAMAVRIGIIIYSILTQRQYRTRFAILSENLIKRDIKSSLTLPSF